MKILITGGAGFIGSNIADLYIESGHEVVIVDNLSSGKKENINPKAKFYKADIIDAGLEEIFKKEKPEIINHHAAQIDVRRSVEDPIFDAKQNILGSINLLQMAVKYNSKKVIFASSGGAIYGEPAYLPVDENHLIGPMAPYGVCKRTVELYLNSYRLNYKLKYTALRYGNVYGPRQDPHGEAGVIAIFIGKMMQGETPLIFGDGKQVRDYVFVKDIARANLLALNKGDNNIYNVGTAEGTSVNTLFSKLKKIIRFNKEAKYSAARKGELEKVYLKYEKIESELGWKPQVDIDEGLLKTVEFFRKSRD